MPRTYETTDMTDRERIDYLFRDPDDYNALIDVLDMAYLDMESDRKNGIEPEHYERVIRWIDELQGPDDTDEEG